MLPRSGRFAVTGIILIVGSPAWLAAKEFVLKEKSGIQDYVFHGVLFLAGIALFDTEKFDDIVTRAKELLPFVKKGGPGAAN